MESIGSEDRLVSATVAGEVTGLQPETIRVWIRERKIPGYRMGRKSVRVSMRDLRKFIADNRI